MAGGMRKAMVYLGLVEDQDRYDSDYPGEYADDYTGERDYRDEREYREVREDRDYRPERDDRALDHEPEQATRREPERAAAAARPATVSSLAERRPTPSGAPRSAEPPRITALHPQSYNDARTIGEHFRDGVPVIMNLTEMDDVDAKRLVDFAAGLIFGLRGSIDKITTKVFLLSPINVHVTPEDRKRIAESGFYNQS